MLRGKDPPSVPKGTRSVSRPDGTTWKRESTAEREMPKGCDGRQPGSNMKNSRQRRKRSLGSTAILSGGKINSTIPQRKYNCHEFPRDE